ncbi:hypothetical protein [Neolewinella antarctica]|uniref:Lipoprotein n=1 Tax=Neolewinella antarctica TaxID=442734 RepID=A0ABX0XDU5_9BACT|nr:hypothetical protein [Neolewinella antarctica]NJC26927.1 hypothetical protein [Neolewinella antarctica]
MRYLILLALPLFLCTCDSAESDNWPALNLGKYNVPVTIMAPDSAKVTSKTMAGVMHDVTIKSLADGYNIQVLASRAETNDMARLKSAELENVREHRYFSRVVREEPNGFVFENKIDTSALYGFRYIIYQGDQEFVFQNGLSGRFSEAQVEAMYAAVKQEK